MPGWFCRMVFKTKMILKKTYRSNYFIISRQDFSSGLKDGNAVH